ncbi:hypothetical protein PsorP6_007725 [Peronosclerospora sorghi]|uniref:Uncharacterized protein n=1 Tax=Peronosclerospora sorghi TaxID=230839 RepID=A0ACC0W8R1_9STRA|nr:hypothetical protein PsorP6_007725 [Peronosclerospora sorghi]
MMLKYCDFHVQTGDKTIDSFTGEDVVEQHTHGSDAVISGVLDAFSHFTASIEITYWIPKSGAVLALPCCRSRRVYRAFDNNKIDFVQCDRLVECLDYMEAIIDFGDDEEDVADVAYEAAVDRKGGILRAGIHVAIIGPSNEGKSSLLNVFARRPAAIVSIVAGTTRDVVQVPLSIAG